LKDKKGGRNVPKRSKDKKKVEEGGRRANESIARRPQEKRSHKLGAGRRRVLGAIFLWSESRTERGAAGKKKKGGNQEASRTSVLGQKATNMVEKEVKVPKLGPEENTGKEGEKEKEGTINKIGRRRQDDIGKLSVEKKGGYRGSQETT